MDTVEELLQRIRAAEERIRVAQEAIRVAEEQRQRAEERRQQANSESRATNLDEYLDACHELVFAKFAVQPNVSLTTKGTGTDPRRKMHPTLITPWFDFVAEQKAVLGKLFLTCSQERVFESRSFLRGLGQRMARRKIGNEKALEFFQHFAVEDPVSLIVDELAKGSPVMDEFDIGSGISFENHVSGLSEWGEEVVQRRARHLGKAGAATPSPPPLQPDQICVFRDRESNRRAMAYLVEYKAPHKIPLAIVRSGLQGDLHVSLDVIQNSDYPAAKKVVIAALCQTFHYMIEGGLTYSFLTTGEAIVFLKINWANPDVLCYHVSEPMSEAAGHPGSFRYYTAVTQILTLTLMALGPPDREYPVQQSQDERESAKRRLALWGVTLDGVLHDVAETPSVAAPESPSFAPSSIDRSPDYQTPLRANKGKSKKTPRAESTSPEPRRHRRGRRRSRGGGGGRGGSGGSLQFCTHACLLGMVQGRPLDRHCPNVALHDTNNNNQHPVSHATWLRLLHEQLKGTLDHGITPLGNEGARAVTFKVTLLQHGYTVISKATVDEFVEDLEHEAAVYQQLRTLQGVDIPVHLGAANLGVLSRTYYYAHGVRITYMMFLSWGGYTLAHGRLGRIGQAEKQELLDLVGRIHSLGVLHRDIRKENVLQDPRTGRFMAIDFERAVIHRPARRSPRTTDSMYASQPCSADSHPLAAADMNSARHMLRLPVQ
ncbi:hypothetical protein B0T16DRAFT_363761 [Cercophora newfieldiana]|uniref:Protein kinase domain-containing protein n=1 Tax=Cercophora newfieldiana TaxID=92897 RepID=A0AA39YQA1_9PEZI|nr:hypothetical protein B0T16DRAFT_363761 [Cercophora newfieldiana]